MSNKKTPPPQQAKQSERLSVLGVVLVVGGLVALGLWFWKREQKLDTPVSVARQENAAKAGKPSARGDAKKTAKDTKDALATAEAFSKRRGAESPAATPAAASSAVVPAPAPAATPPSPGHRRISGERLAVTPAATLSSEPWKMREEKIRLGQSIREIGDEVRANGVPPAELEFPTFDGGSVTLTDFEFRPQALPNEGVFFAKVKGEPSGGHVLLSYVNNALTGSIHAPSLGIFLDIRNGTPQGGIVSDIFLAQLDTSKMPTCGTCNPNSTFNLSRPRTTGGGGSGGAPR